MRSRRMLDSLLMEMPVGVFQTVGDFSKSHSFRHEVDRKLVTSPVVASKVKNKFGAHLDEVFDLYFVNAKGLRDWAERGEVKPETLYAKRPEGLGLDPAQVPAQEDHITVVYCNNVAVPHEPMTPWIIAHRFAHAIRRLPAYEHFSKEVTELVKNVAGNALPEPPSSRYGGWGSYSDDDVKQTRSRELAMRLISQQIGTMRSARTGQVRDVYEFVHEVFAQFLMTGRIKFNRIGNQGVHTSYTYGKPNYRQGDPYANDNLDMAERDLNYYCEQAVGACVNKVFVM